MKKLFISVPMKGRTQENIQKSKDFLHKYAELVVGEKLEVINSTINMGEMPFTAHDDVYCLGLSISYMADADYVAGIDYCNEIWHGCDIERSVAQMYGIPFLGVDWGRIPAFEDMRKVMDDYWRNQEKCMVSVQSAG